jgi:hypothetical protein
MGNSRAITHYTYWPDHRGKTKAGNWACTQCLTLLVAHCYNKGFKTIVARVLTKSNQLLNLSIDSPLCGNTPHIIWFNAHFYSQSSTPVSFGY